MKKTFLLCTVLIAAGCALLLSGCASKPKVDWNARIGNYTFDQAVIELGPPARQSDLSDKRKVAEWVTGYSGGSSMSIGFGGYGGYGRRTGVGVSQTVGSGGYEYILRLTFAPDGKLIEWKRN
ncbi:MAG: hypothetical protein RLY20_478 [Verrucomicrobiota bacterium]|jgi:hypothetical protein